MTEDHAKALITVLRAIQATLAAMAFTLAMLTLVVLITQ